MQTQTQPPTTYLYPNSFITTLLNKLTLLTSPHWSPPDQIFKSWYHWFEHNFGQHAGTDPNIYDIYVLTDYDHRRGTVEFVHSVAYIEEHLMRELGFRDDDDGEDWCLARAVAGRNAGNDGMDGVSMVQPCTRAFVTKLAIEYAGRLERENLYALWECILEKEMDREAEDEERLWNDWLDWIDIMLRHGFNRNGFYRNIEMEIMWFLECRWTDRMGGFVREAIWEGIRRWTFDVELVGWTLFTLNGG